MGELDGKVALVTGGSRGIGAAIAVRLADHGADVAFTYRNASDRVEKVVQRIESAGRRAVAIGGDGADRQAVISAVDRTVDELGGIDILVNNAGVFHTGPLEEVTEEELEETLAIHVRAAFVASQHAARTMRSGGRIISIGSCFAERVPYEGLTVYAMTKAALVGLTKGLARDLGPRGITATVVHPGCTDTDMNPADSPDAAGELPYIAVGHYAAPDDIARTVAHLAGEGGRYVTGTAISVDGGYAA
ncbi:SDR family NAD(P)-dependent oxidoreductase [Nocardia sp. NBC_01329]|uniref:SDR family NAD(P)-dependent oxidoreductase n=1 Tax=Nocardia sp. NBC_01329 TaxID=2903594 RepID=UPI002E1232EB|nr:SDR family oxidoreductase [Nocardia sp. NBC_01329]